MADLTVTDSSRARRHGTCSASGRPLGLRPLLGIDAATCILTGIVAVAVAGPVADLIDVGTSWVRGIGAFLLVYGAGLGLLARAPRSILRPGTTATIAWDGLWVAVTVVLAVAGTFSGTGVAVMGVVGLVVGTLGVAKAGAVHR
jgi:hypothetical protein